MILNPVLHYKPHLSRDNMVKFTSLVTTSIFSVSLIHSAILAEEFEFDYLLVEDIPTEETVEEIDTEIALEGEAPEAEAEMPTPEQVELSVQRVGTKVAFSDLEPGEIEGEIVVTEPREPLQTEETPEEDIPQ